MYQTYLAIELVISFRLDNDVNDTLVKETENDDLIVGFVIIKAAPLNVLV